MFQKGSLYFADWYDCKGVRKRKSFDRADLAQTFEKKQKTAVRLERQEARKPMKLSHYDEQGQAHMVDVSEKPATRREAKARAFVEMSAEVLAALPQNPKGNPLEVARFAGIQAAKQTSTLIPMCHPLALSHVDIQTVVKDDGVAVEATVATVAGTGVEMEAMVAASIAALTIYDMTKALDKSIRIREVVLLAKSGGKSGEYRRIEEE